MKQVLVSAALAVACVFISCKDSTTSTTDTKMSDSSSTSVKEESQADKNAENMKAIYKGIEKGDLSVMDSIVADDILDHDSPRGEIRGRDSVKKFLADFHNHIADMKFDIIAQATGGDYHFALTKMTGKSKDASMGMPANMNINDTSVDVVRINNGKAVEHWGFIRPHQMKSMDKKKGKM